MLHRGALLRDVRVQPASSEHRRLRAMHAAGAADALGLVDSAESMPAVRALELAADEARHRVARRREDKEERGKINDAKDEADEKLDRCDKMRQLDSHACVVRTQGCRSAPR